jgi:hypothetical protein
MTHQNALCQEEYELVLAQIKQRLSHKILESQNRSLAVLRAKAWLSLNHKTPNNLLNFNEFKSRRAQKAK